MSANSRCNPRGAGAVIRLGDMTPSGGQEGRVYDVRGVFPAMCSVRSGGYAMGFVITIKRVVNEGK